MLVKCDIASFFASIDREILKQILRKKIKCSKTLNLLYIIIDSANSLSPVGLPLGNSTSQNFANIYMNELDQYCKRVLGLKYYVRYMDDFFIFVDGKEEAKRILELIATFITEKLNMELNERKTKYFPIKQGLNAIGFKIYCTHKLLRDDSKNRIKRKVKTMPNLIVNKNMSISKAEQMLNSWKGHAEYADSTNLISYLLNKYRFLYLETKGLKTTLRINKKELYKHYDEKCNSRLISQPT